MQAPDTKHEPPPRLPRRATLAALGAGSAAVIAGCTAHAQRVESPALPPAEAKPSPLPRALAGNHRPLPLPFAPTSLQGLSERLITSHHENNYGGAVRNLNLVEQALADIGPDTPPAVVAALRERELTFRNSKCLHEAYFANLGGDGRRSGAIDEALTDAYGSSARWEAQFRATAMGLGGGSGWVVLAYELDSGGLRTAGSSGHPQALATAVPLLVLDMYEHSYHIDFGAGVARYIDAFFSNLHWDEVNRRLAGAQRARTALEG